MTTLFFFSNQKEDLQINRTYGLDIEQLSYMNVEHHLHCVV